MSMMLSDSNTVPSKAQTQDPNKPKKVFDEERHRPVTTERTKISKWRIRERMKTTNVAIIYCLNIGVDPPDTMKTDPCARMECWIDPFSAPAQKSLENIGKTLQTQYERWQPRAKYKLCLDPTVEEVKKMCIGLRRNAKDERILFHYNGHGVPRPTANGEIWVFNKNFTQYIPLSIYELQTWMASPSLYVFDCSSAGTIIQWFLQFSEQREKEYEKLTSTSANSSAALNAFPVKDFILLGACGANEMLPMNPQLPADVFTSCLTSPIKMALRWYCTNSFLGSKENFHVDIVDKIPGKLADRKTPIGELNWIFTAITDTIAWNMLPRDLFQKLFRQDLLVASLFRNYLLAERILKTLGCTPVSYPKLPSTHQHAMWDAWDHAIDWCFSQMQELLSNPQYEYQSSSFFADQLTAFEVWLEYGSENKKPPEQLPIVLQVLLSQTHRLRALQLLGRFLDLGPWAVNFALSVGIFPYVLKLLQSPALELRQILVFIWAKILALDKSCQMDLIKENGHVYFVSVLGSQNVPSDQRTASAFILSVISNNCRPGQTAILNSNLLSVCAAHMTDKDPLLRRWSILCAAKIWESFEEAKYVALREGILDQFVRSLRDPIPEVRAATVYSLGLFIGMSSTENNEDRMKLEMNIARSMAGLITDASTLVRKELLVTMCKIIRSFEAKIRELVAELISEEEKSKDPKSKSSNQSSENSAKAPAADSPLLLVWKLVSSMATDSFPPIATAAEAVVKHIQDMVLSSPFFNSATNTPSKSFGILTSPSKPKPQPRRLGILKMPGPSTAEQGGTSPNSSNVPTTPNSMSSSMKKTTSALDFNQFMDDGMENSNNNSPTFSNSPRDLSDTFVWPMSNYYDWSCEHFSKPMLVHDHGNIKTSQAEFEQSWRIQRNRVIEEQGSRDIAPLLVSTETPSGPPRSPKSGQRSGPLLSESKGMEPKTPTSSSASKRNRFDEQVAVIDTGPDHVSSSHILLHPYEPTLIMADHKDGVSVWDREFCKKLNHFKNSSSNNNSDVNSKTTSMVLLNPADATPLLLLGSDDGVVRLWSNYDDPEDCKILTSWKALPNLQPGSKGSGMVLHYDPFQTQLFASGDVDFIRLWDLEREVVVQDLKTFSQTCITSLHYSPESRMLISGAGDGAVRLFDIRANSQFTALPPIQDHKQWIVSTAMSKARPNILITGSAAGDIKFWDLANTSAPLKTFQAFKKSPMISMAAHPRAPLLACGSQNNKLKVFNFDFERLSLICYHDGWLGQRIGQITCLDFHPYLLLLAAGAADSIVSVYTKNRVIS